MAKTKIRFEDLEQGLTSPIALTSNAVNSVSIDGTTFSVDTLNNRVGIGTETPFEKLDIRGVLQSKQGIGYGVAGTRDLLVLGLNKDTSNLDEITSYVWQAEKLADALDIKLHLISQKAVGAYGLNYDNTSVTRTNEMTFYNGNIGIGTTGPSQKLHVIGNILASGTITPSDKRLKSNVKDIDNISEKFDKLRPVSYDKKHGLDSEKSNFEYGFIADEFIELFPELVQEDGEDKIKSINYTSIIALLVKEIQTLKNK